MSRLMLLLSYWTLVPPFRLNALQLYLMFKHSLTNNMHNMDFARDLWFRGFTYHLSCLLNLDTLNPYIFVLNL